MSVRKNLILARFEEHVRTLQALVYVNVEQKVTLMDAISTMSKLLESSPSISKLDYFPKIANFAREVQRLTDLVESVDLELQTMCGLVEEASSLRE